MKYSPNCVYLEVPHGTQVFHGSATTTEVGERAFAMVSGVVVKAVADGSEVVASAAGSRALAKGLGTRAVAYSEGSTATAYYPGALAIPIAGKATAFLGAAVYSD